MVESVIKSGDLSELLLLDLALLASADDSAVHLHLDRGKSTRGFLFSEGRLIGAESSLSAESFAAMLVRRNRMSADDPLLAQMDAAGLGATQVLLDSERFPAPAVVQELGLWVTLLFVQCFAWREGRYALVPVAEGSLPTGPRAAVRVAPALSKGIWKRMSQEAIEAELGPLLGRRPRKGPSPRFPVDSFELAPPLLEWVSLLNDSQTLGQWINACPLGIEDAQKAVLLMSKNGSFLLTTEEEAGVAGTRQDGEVPSDVEWSAFIDEFSTADEQGAAGQGALSLDTEAGTLAGGEGASVSDENEAAEESAGESPVASSSQTGEAQSSAGGIDMSSIRFNRGRRSRMEGGTFHSKTPGTREEVVERAEAASVGVMTGTAQALDEDLGMASEAGTGVANTSATEEDSLGGLFDGMGIGDGKPAAPRSGRKVAPPRSGNQDGAWGASGNEDEVADEIELDDQPPVGPWTVIEEEEWARLTTDDKVRVERLCESIRATESTHYFEWFGISPDSPAGALKKAYFQQARLYHPDALVDEPDLYARVAEGYFALLSEAYEILSDEEAREKYIKKHILGEKDEDELALEKVQQILAAENDFKSGIRLMNHGKLSDAMRKFKAAVDGYPDEAEYVAYYGFTLFRVNQSGDQSRAQDGIDLVMRAVELKPAAAKPYHLLGKIHLQRSDYKEARTWLRKTLRINADNPDAVRDYRRVEDLLKGGDAGGDQAKAKGGLKGLLGRFKKEPKQQSRGDKSIEDWLEAQTKKD